VFLADFEPGARSLATDAFDLHVSIMVEFIFMEKLLHLSGGNFFPMPGMITPTIDLEEIDKKIAELKAVENWLTMSTGFVQMTIKTLQMQKSALESLQAAGDAAAKSVAPKPPKSK
jgi:hypothetical protein